MAGDSPLGGGLTRTELAQAKQNVQVMKTDTEINAQKIAKIKADVEYARYQLEFSTDPACQGAGSERRRSPGEPLVGTPAQVDTVGMS